MRRGLGVVLALGLTVGVGLAQGPRLMPAPPDSAAAPPDTAVATLSGPSAWGRPEAIRLWPTSSRFGAVSAVVLDFPQRVASFAADSLDLGAPWLVPATPQRSADRPWWRRLLSHEPRVDGPDVSDLPPAAPGTWRTVVPARVYRTGPVRVAWAGGAIGEVVQVAGVLSDPSAVADIRDPRGLGWYRLRMLVALLAALLIVLLVWRLRRRRRRAALPPDRPLVPPAWYAAAHALWGLDADDLPARGMGRDFLDRLAGILRAYLAGRFWLPAPELTAQEIAVAALESGWPKAWLRGFVTLIAAADADRYAPSPIDAARCRRDLTTALSLIAAVRIEARYTPVDVMVRTAGEEGWERLQEKYGSAAALQESPC